MHVFGTKHFCRYLLGLPVLQPFRLLPTSSKEECVQTVRSFSYAW